MFRTGGSFRDEVLGDKRAAFDDDAHVEMIEPKPTDFRTAMTAPSTEMARALRVRPWARERSSSEMSLTLPAMVASASGVA